MWSTVIRTVVLSRTVLSSRAEFTTMLVKAFELSPQTGKVFADTSRHWARDYIATAEAYRLVSGYNAGTFGPDDLITREQTAL